MDLLENCILLQDKKLNKLVDKSNEIASIDYDKKENIYHITFKIGGDTVYNYNAGNVIWLTEHTEVPFDNSIVYANGHQCDNIEKIVSFGNWTKILFSNGTIKAYKSCDLKIDKNYANRKGTAELVNYLLEVSQIVREWNIEEGFLEKELSGIFISKESILQTIISGKRLFPTHYNKPIICPWASNASQLQAIINAMTEEISIIQGPPGTGKTQTILNIIANIIANGNNVAVVSGNNEATRNVLEKMEDKGLGGICAFLGNSENVQEFIKREHGIEELIPILSFSESSDIKTCQALSSKVRIVYELIETRAKLNGMLYEYQNQYRISKSECDAIENKVPDQIKTFNGKQNDKLLLASFMETLAEKKKIKLKDRRKAKSKFGIRKIHKLMPFCDVCVIWLQHQFYADETNRIKALIAENERKITYMDSSNTIEAYRSASEAYFLSSIRENFKKYIDKPFSANIYYKSHFTEFTNRYPVVFSTTHSLAHCSKKGFLYDYLIVDESSQVDLCSATIALSCAKKLICVGDMKQLPHVVQSSNIPILDNIFEKYKLNNAFNYAKQSLLSSLTAKYGKEVKSTLLNEHYRCDPMIIGFCNRRFYDDKLLIQTTHKAGNGIQIITTEPNFERNRTNERQADVIKKEIIPELNGGTTGVVTPYRKQVELIQNKLHREDILVDTVHKFQGKERDTIIISTVANKITEYEDSEKTDFLNNEYLINVAVSRAKKKLYVIASENLLKQEKTLMNDLSRYVSYYGEKACIRETNVYSVFDLMYEKYSPILKEMKKQMLPITDISSENIIANLLLQIRKRNHRLNFGFVLHYPLRRVIRPDLLDDIDDRKFVTNYCSHCDFAIFRKIDRSIFLVIEVDGSQHQKSSIQGQRDERKDRLLKAVGIPVLRLRTTETDCEEKITKAICSAID